MKKIFATTIILSSIICMASCNSGKKSGAADTKNAAQTAQSNEVKPDANFTFENLNGKWLFVEAGGNDVKSAETAPFLIFDIDSMRMSGNSGCNNMGAQIDRRARGRNALMFGNAYSTKMMCSPESMKVETAVIDAVNDVRTFERMTDGKLRFIDENDKIVAILERELVN